MDMPKHIAARMVIERDGEERKIEVRGRLMPAQYGGMIDPSWSAYIEGIEADAELSDEELAEAEEALWEAAA